MANEFNDLKGFLFLVLLTIPLTMTTNINCNEKPFYCVNATHFMICVDLGNGVSSTIDDFVIPCPSTTVCHPNNRFECEFPHIEVTPPLLKVIGVSATDEKNVDSPLIYSVTTTAQIQETTSPPIDQNLPTLEEVISPKLIELLDNSKEEYTDGNVPFFNVTTILPSNAVSSNEISTKKFYENNIVTDSDTIYDAQSTTETTTLTDNNTEVLITDNSLAAENTTPVAELFDSMSKNNLQMNKTTHQLGTVEKLQVGDNLHATTTTITPLIDTEQTFDLNVTSDNMIPVNHTNYQRSFQNNVASLNLKLSNANKVTINTISTTEGVPKTTSNYVEPTIIPDNPQTTTIQDNLRLEGIYMLTTDAPGKFDDHIKILSNQTFGEEKASVRQDTIGAESITYEPLAVSNKAVEVESNNSFILSPPLTKEETPFNSVRDDSLPEKVTELSFLAKPDVTDIIITTENTTNTATEALSTTDSIITVKIDIDTKSSEDLEKKSITGTFLDDAKLYQDASKSNVTSNMKLDNAKERIVNGTISFDETTNNMVYTTVSTIEPSTGVTDEHESETINILNWQDKETTTFRNTVLNNDQYAGIASTIPMSYSTGDVYKTTPNPLDEKLSSTSSYDTAKDSSSNVLKLEIVDNVLNISIPLLNEASGTVPSLEPINYTADILYEADAKSVIQTTIIDIYNYESNSGTEPVDGHTPIDEVKISSMHPTAITEQIDTTYKNSEDVTFIPQYTNTIDEKNKKYYEETTNKVQNDFIISQAETPTSPTYAIEQGNIELVRPENVPNLIIPTTEKSSTDLIKQGKASEIHTSISNNFVTTEHSNTDINKTGNILFPSTLPINETHTKDIKDIMLTSATAASQTELNQVSEHDTVYKITMGAIEVDTKERKTPNLITVEPSNVKVTNVEDTKLTYNYSSNMALISPQLDNVLTTQAKVNSTIITEQHHAGTYEITYSNLTQIKNNTSEKKIKQNETHGLGTGEYTPEPSKNIENILATTLTPIIITSRSMLNKDENVVKLKEALSDLSTENPLLTGTDFINSLKTTTDELLTTTKAYDFYPKNDVTTKYSKMHEEKNTATLRNDINLKLSNNIGTNNPISDPIITAETNMSNREPNPSTGYEIKTLQSKPVLLKDINDTMLTATAASAFAYTTESNQMSEHDTEYKITMESIEVDYIPSFITMEPSKVKVTNVEDTKITYNCSSDMLLILPQEDKVLITQAKGNNTIITDQNDGTNDIKSATLTQIQNNNSEKNTEQNATLRIRTGEYIPKPNKNNENILATTLTPIIITSRSMPYKDENVVKLKEALSDPSTKFINSLKTKTDEILTTTEAYDLYPKYDVTTKYSNMNEEDNTAILGNYINLKVFSNIATDNPISDTKITTETNMGNRYPNPSSGYDTMLTSATTASSFAYTTEWNPVSEHDTEYKRIMGPVNVDYTPSLTIVEPNDIKLTNVEDTKYSKMNEEGNPLSLRNYMNLKVFSNIKTDNQMSDTIITTKTYIDNREPNPSSGYKTKSQTVQSDKNLTTPKVIVATIEKSIPIHPKVNTNDPTNTITHSITKPTEIVETVAETTLDDVILTEFMLANDTVNLNKIQLHLQNMSYSNITAHKEALHKSGLNMTFKSEKSAILSNREVMDLENGNNTLMVTEINIEIDGNKNQNDISIKDKYESSTAYFEIPSRIEITTPNPLIHQKIKIFANDVEHKPITDAVGSAGFHLMQNGNESISSSSIIESKVKTTSGNESKYNYSSLNNRTYKVLITDKEQSNKSKASGNNKTNIEVSNSLGNITEQQSIINDKVVTSYVQPHIINKKIINLVNNESNTTILKTKDSSASINLNNTPSSFNCWNNTRGKYADSKDCRKFYICLGKLDPIIGSCPNNTVFSEINKQCTRNLSHCVRNNQFHCVYEGRFSDFIKDNTFYICVKYKRHFLRYKLQCEIGYHLNKATVKCEKNVENSSQSGSSVSENSQTKEKSENLDNKEDFECKQEGKFPYAKDCRKYYDCSKNNKNEYRRKIKKCTDDKVYDIEKEKCISGESNEC